MCLAAMGPGLLCDGSELPCSSRRGFPRVMTTAHKFSALSPGRRQDLRLQICFSRSVSRELFDDLNKRSRRLLEQFKRLCTPIRLPPPLQSCRFHHERMNSHCHWQPILGTPGIR